MSKCATTAIQIDGKRFILFRVMAIKNSSKDQQPGMENVLVREKNSKCHRIIIKRDELMVR